MSAVSGSPVLFAADHVPASVAVAGDPEDREGLVPSIVPSTFSRVACKLRRCELTGADTLAPASGPELRLGSERAVTWCAYLLSSLASAIFACQPASEMAFMKASALAGVAALPERMLRNIMCLP